MLGQNVLAFQEYSYAAENGTPSNYSGVRSTRYDTRFEIGPGPYSRTTPFDGNPVVYETEWVLLSSDAQNFVEMGTGNQCNYFNFWYVFYRYQGMDNYYWTQSNVGNGAHQFSVDRYGGIWNFLVDVTNEKQLSWNVSGVLVEAGLESHDPIATAYPHDYSALRAERDPYGQSSAWDGFDYYAVTNPAMCGYWRAPDQWHAGEHVTC